MSPLYVVCLRANVLGSHLEVLYSRGLLCSIAECRALAGVPTTVLQDVIKGLKVWSRTKTQTHEVTQKRLNLRTQCNSWGTGWLKLHCEWELAFKKLMLTLNRKGILLINTGEKRFRNSSVLYHGRVSPTYKFSICKCPEYNQEDFLIPS